MTTPTSGSNETSGEVAENFFWARGFARTTAVDAMQHGFRPIIVCEAVGDRLAVTHEQSPIDLQAT